MRTERHLHGVQAQQHRTLTHKFPEDFICREPFIGFTDPFRYIPHPAVAEAAGLVIGRIDSDPSLSEAFAEGKMLGVLVCRQVISTESPSVISTERSERRNLLYLAAFSGNVGGRSHIDGFVPPVFDLLDPSGHFKVREAEITALNHRIESLSHSPELAALEHELQEALTARDAALEAYRIQIAENRIKREDIREQTSDPSVLAGLIKESQFEKAELKRLKISWENKIADVQTRLSSFSGQIAQLKGRRAMMSDELQDWIFRQYIVHNALGESSSIADIFASDGLVPPGGTGECAAPKLLEYAYRNGLEPLAMGEFWYGKSPDTAVRTHGHFYPSCTSKCGPLLGYMLKGLRERRHVDGIGIFAPPRRGRGPALAGRGPMESTVSSPSPLVIYEDEAIIVAEKPSGMPSVPTLDGSFSMQDYLTSALYLCDDCVGEGDGADDGDRVDGNEGLQFFGVIAAHRLDMDTSGVMVFAKNRKALTNLHRQFEEHTVRKTYMARISAPDCLSAPDCFLKNIVQETVLPSCPHREGPATKSWEGLFPDQCFSGSITLPLSPDYDERPRQKVDFKQGKAAQTDYEVLQTNPDGTADLLLYPHTGRTHQLRVHCAHILGLGRPILGDRLYGGWSVDSVCTQTQSPVPVPNQLPDQTPELIHSSPQGTNGEAHCIKATRLHLHALSITFRHPTTGEELTFTSRELSY